MGLFESGNNVAPQLKISEKLCILYLIELDTDPFATASPKVLMPLSYHTLRKPSSRLGGKSGFKCNGVMRDVMVSRPSTFPISIQTLRVFSKRKSSLTAQLTHFLEVYKTFFKGIGEILSYSISSHVDFRSS